MEISMSLSGSANPVAQDPKIPASLSKYSIKMFYMEIEIERYSEFF